MPVVQPRPQDVEIAGRFSGEFPQILTPEALAFVAELHRRFEPRRQELLARRAARQKQFDAGLLPDFLPETRHIRESEWKIAPQPKDMLDRRVEITGPTDRKMVINALNSGASTFMADFEDANCPTWHNMIDGQLNLRDAVRRTISFEQGGKHYQVADGTAVLNPQPRGWHLDEKHVIVDAKPVSGAIFDFALFFFHNAKELLARGSGPYFYLPKMESHLEARLWNDVFVVAEEELGVKRGSIKATALIETLVAAFEMDEILYELREHSAGLNIGRWDYIFSCIKKFRANKDFCLADRSQVTMTAPFMRAYALLLVKTCHRRGAPAMGGRAAQQHLGGHPVSRRLARRQWLRAGVKPDGRRRHRRDLALADLAVDPLAKRRARRRAQGHRGAFQAAPRRGAAEGPRLPRRCGVQRRQVRAGREAFRAHHHRRQVRRISHAACVRADRLSAVLVQLSRAPIRCCTCGSARLTSGIRRSR